MRAKLFFAACAICFLAMSAFARAASFDSSVEPSIIDAGNVLVNFTVNNTNAAIVQVNFTLPSGFSYYGPHGTTSNGLFLPTPTPRWYNATTANIVANGGDEKFWFKVTTASTGAFPRSFEFNVSTTDATGGFNSTNVSVTVDDLSPPKWSANSTSPSSPAAYVLNRSYIFNITWVDNVYLDHVSFEWNSTTNYTNTSSPAIQSLGSGKYSITLTDLTQDNYTYKWYANDSLNGAENSTDTFGFNVTRANNPINTYFNGNLNQGLTINDGETINITVIGAGVTIYKNGTNITDQFTIKSYLILEYNDILPRGYHEFKFNSTGSRNYTANTTGATYSLNVVYPPPKYSISTSIPSTWARNSFALFNITWTDDNDANGFSKAFIQLNHSGTATNYTMSRITGTTRSTYELNLSRPMALTWRAYANNSYNSWNVTNLTTVTISKITPTLSLTADPAWNVLRGSRTSIHCTSNQVSVNLYRDAALVSNPDIQTLGTGAYVYVCNNTASTNYSSARAAKILNVLRYAADISFAQAASLISIKQNSSNSTTVIVENVGNASQPVNFTIENITSSWYTLNATDATANIGQKVAFLVNFSIAESVEIKDYIGAYKAATINKTIVSAFTLRILPKEETHSDISSELALYRVNMTKVWAEINKTKAEKSDVNVTLAEQKILEAKEKIELAENYINNNDYFSAYQLFDSIKSLISTAEAELEAALETREEIYEVVHLPDWAIWAVVGTGIGVGGLLVYLLWPQPGYSTKTGRYTYKTPKERGARVLSEAKEKIVNKIASSKPKPAYKSSFKKPSVEVAGIKIEQPIAKTGRYTIDKGKVKTAQEKISEKFSKIKDLFKRKRKGENKEIELKY